MLKLECKFRNFILENVNSISAVTATIIALLIRFFMMDYVSVDMEKHLLPWYEIIKENGQIHALKNTIGDYNFPYQVLIAIMTYIPINPVYGYKLISILFDFLLGGICGKLAFELTKEKWKGFFAYIIVINLPMVFLNSSFWGQCDSIYTFFCLCSVYALLKNRIYLCFLLLGCGFSFKLQTVFIIPFYLYMYIKERRFTILNFLLIPIPVVVLSLPALLQKRSVFDVFGIYFLQTKEYRFMSMNYPSFWNLLIPNMSMDNYTIFKRVAILFTMLLLMMVLLYISKKNDFNDIDKVNTCFLMAYTCVLFLPSMHERYDYLPVILGIIIVASVPRTIWLFLGIVIINMMDYAAVLSKTTLNNNVLSVVNVLIYILYAKVIISDCRKVNYD